ncbi:uncharacterized protein LOC108199018 isoform X2 [Daucus carota subsp. sativus]|uniref:uncharacterized protein LOC108199018 isoform X2 n=1 Tax=Daucus carota subsp. sativus TaxID=79200 RepID=UPI0007EEFD23|nr:PREDICTED: uncharacterized protein LOC108199018 isoform X2 [Daucus carota subsp. sativus]
MSKLIYILPLVLLLSLHACKARHLSLNDNRNSRRSHTVVKNLHSKSLPSLYKETDSEPEVVQAREANSPGANELTNTVMAKDSEQTIPKNDNKKGGEIDISHPKEATQPEGWRRQARSTTESSPSEARETADTKESEIVDDVVAMDYAQPHRKPPIHNRKL